MEQYYQNQLACLCRAVQPLDEQAMQASRRHWDGIAKPLNGLGTLEDLLVKVAGIQQNADIRIERKAVVVFCSDNGIVQEGVTQTDSSVTAVVTENFAKGCASVNRIAAVAGADVIPVDVGVAGELREPGVRNCKIGYGTRNFRQEPAMTVEQALAAIHTGIGLAGELKDSGYDLLAAGEMGIGNTTTSSAIASVLLGCPVEQVTGRGAGLSNAGLEKKIMVIKGLRMIEEKLGIPVLGVIPMESIDLDEEDSLSERLDTESGMLKEALLEGLDIVVIRLPHISNFTDFHVLEQEPGVFLRYVNRPSQLGMPDLVILPGTKNTMADLKWLRESGLESGLLRLVAAQIPLLGICGGYQMLGRSVSDPDFAEGGGEIRGMGLLDVETIFAEQKTRTRISGKMARSNMFANESVLEVTGYEIHMGITRPVLHKQESGEAVGEVAGEVAGKPVITLADGRMDGMERADGLVFGSYLHGLFDNVELKSALLLRLAEKKGIKLSNPAGNWADYKETQYEKLADLVRRSLDMNAVYEILEKGI